MSSSNPVGTPPHGTAPSVSYNRPLVSAVPELVRALTDEERRVLLDRIAHSLSIHDRAEEKIVHGELRKERRREIIEADFASLSLWERLSLWFRRLFSSSSDENVFLSFRLHQMKRTVATVGNDLVDFDLRTAEPPLARAVADLYAKVEPVIPLFRMLWKGEETLRRVIEALLEARVPEAKGKLNEFVGTQELQDEFKKAESRGYLKQLVLDRISTYVEGIHPDVMKQLEEGILPAYYLKDLVLYDFDEFFSMFQVPLASLNRPKQPSFKRIAIARLFPALESLHLALYNAKRVAKTVDLFPEILEYFVRVRRGDEAPGDNLMENGESKEAQVLRRTLVALRGQVDETDERLRLVELIRYFRNDPYYRFMAYVPRLRLKDFYYANLKIAMLQTLDDRFHDLRTGVVGRMIQEVFPKPLQDFAYYHPNVSSLIQNAGINAVKNYQTLKIIKNFIDQIYTPELMEFMRIIGRIIPARSREAVSDLTIFLAGLDDVRERLGVFDAAFSPDADEGKTLYRYRFASEGNTQQQAAFRALVGQLDRESRSIIERFQDQMRGIHQVFVAIKNTAHDYLNERYAAFETRSKGTKPFDDKLDHMISAVGLSGKIVGQMIVVESNLDR